MKTTHILTDLDDMFNRSSPDNYFDVLATYRSAYINGKTFVGLGAGRMGYSLRAHIMRLSHLGCVSYMIGDTTLPRVNESSVILVNSSSGETPSNVLLATQAKDAGSHIITFTCNPKSTLGKMADNCYVIPISHGKQLMKSAYEQYTYLLLDALAEDLKSNCAIDTDFVNNNHSILE